MSVLLRDSWVGDRGEWLALTVLLSGRRTYKT